VTHLTLHHRTKPDCGSTGPICYKDGVAWSVNVIGDEVADWRYELHYGNRNCSECDKHIRAARDLKMILSPNDWPKWPLLPMKRHGDRSPNCGIIIGDPSKQGTVYFVPGAYIFRLNEEQTTRDGIMVSAVSLLNEGWQVD